MAAKLSTHALDLYVGKPAQGLQLALYRVTSTGPENDPSFALILRTQTNHDGRTDAPLLSPETFALGEYEIRFNVGVYLAEKKLPQFLSVVPIRFNILEEAPYHVPLLFSPWTYSTYRGS
jgi:5-hydroxyisourate hydrolase